MCCGSSITIHNRPSFPIVYTSHGTSVAAAFNGNCKKCKKVYYYSYFEDSPASESDVNKDSWKLICKLQNKWIHHKCEVPDCSEGYISVDSLEKVCRPMCATPKEKLYVNNGEGNFVKCCTNTPTLGGKSQKASKFCWEHLHLQENDGREVDKNNESDGAFQEKVVKNEACIYPISAGFIDQKVVGDIPEHDGLNSEQGGCKSRERIKQYMDHTAGLLTVVRPCRMIVKAQEMYTCESCTHVYAFLLLTFGRTADGLQKNEDNEFIISKIGQQ